MDAPVSCGILCNLSSFIGTSEPALRLLLTVLAGYPIAFVHRKYLYGKNANLQHIFFILSGFALGYWNYGLEMFHCIFAMFFTYCTLLLLKGTALSVAITFIFNLSYLLIGYYYSGTNDYDINWTMPHCILVLRLIGVAFDFYDGHQPEETLSAENKKVALLKRPSLLEFFGNALFPSAFLVGPQFPLKRYQNFIAGNFSEKGSPGIPPNSIAAALHRFVLGVAYLSVFQILGFFVSDDYMLSEEFGSTSFFTRMLLLGMWGRYTLYKYISCWLLTEGACIYFGMTHNGEDDKGQVKWDGVENVKLSIFENTYEFNHYIQSFNTNTNHWVAQYIYKRLKFLGNRQLSQLAALGFLAIWHGFHSGYYVCFFFEFMVIFMEREIKSLIKSNDTLSGFFYSPEMQLPIKIALRVYTFVFMGWCLLPFALLKFDRYWTGFVNANYVGIILFLLWPVVYGPLLRLVFKKTKRAVVDDTVPVRPHAD